ncbi:PMCA-type calcium-translocating P-type ATPase [Thamnocephalis sphaerospora]|uniref:Calcium-transporting ATPase n=1 Tax=Thamnocephalis sphaerospora TaxID=78915 RepID=A0A4P9XW38_9FUNG|nr:PMCA-type calcium-translocating P-type ATPase [Thamnocephalis sphaerospora]|eukprot:RKP10508.1 PMCA-type calcium-translocating P-type ATPase [Thamnocephalis sphaerospora]
MSAQSAANERTPLVSHGGSDNASFGVSADQLCALMEDRERSGLESLGGVAGVTRSLRVDTGTGLCQDESGDHGKPFEARRRIFGANVLPDAKIRPFWSYVSEALQDRTLVLLSIGAMISLAIGIYEDYSPSHPEDEPRVGWIEGTAILVAVLVVVFTNSINDFEKEKQFRKLNAEKEARNVKVIRDGREHEISVHDVNVGDVMKLEPGEVVAVDGLYLSGHNLKCDESSATGESDEVKKDSDEAGGDCFILSGSKILEGVATMLVIAVGERSFHGRTMMAMRDDETQETPLQQKLDQLAEQIAKMGASAALLMLIVLTLKLVITTAIAGGTPQVDDLIASIVKIVIQAITILVVAVPEGLPMAVTLALAYATTQMLKDNNLVRVLSACETMGSATTVCSDKTGSLAGVDYDSSNGEHRGAGGLNAWKRAVPRHIYEIVCEGIASNSTAFQGQDDKGGQTFIGSKTEGALLDMITNLGEDYRQLRHGAHQLKVYPFSSQKKIMAAVVETNMGLDAKKHASSATQQCRLYVKGASEIVLSSCTHYVAEHGEIKSLNKTARANFERIIAMYADKALRTLCLAYRDVTNKEVASFDEEEAPAKNLVCIGIVGIQDPLREGVVESVQICRRAGVYVKMITGDNVRTASAIARNAGILTKGGIVMSGQEFRNLSEEERTRIIPRLQVLARSSPVDKQIVVRTLQGLGEVVGMTGDGTNDAPALKMADVGFSMGIAGTEVAKEASSIILMDDNFNSIVAAIKWGRAVSDSVRKFLAFQLTVNICAVVLAFVSAVADPNNESVLSATQLLWVNLIMDTLAALALATERPSDELMLRYPLARNAPLINFSMWKMIIGQAVFQVVISLLLLHLGPRIFHLGQGEEDRAIMRTVVFNAFVFLQIFNEFNCRRIDDSLNFMRGICSNYAFLTVQVFVVVGQFLIVTFGGIAFKTVSLSWPYWLATVGIGALSLPIGVLLRLLPDCGLADQMPDQERRPLVSQERMRWEAAINEVQTKLRVYGALRRSPVMRRIGTPKLADAVECGPAWPSLQSA